MLFRRTTQRAAVDAFQSHLCMAALVPIPIDNLPRRHHHRHKHFAESPPSLATSRAVCYSQKPVKAPPVHETLVGYRAIRVDPVNGR